MSDAIVLYACEKNIDKMRKLLDAGADPNQISSGCFGYASLHYANKEIAHLLISRGANVNIRSYYGEIPLHTAVSCNDLALTQFLVKNGAFINAKTGWGNTPLFLAIGYGYLKIVQFLVENGADVNLTVERNSSPLHWASRQRNYEICKYLLSVGADTSICDVNGETAYDVGSDEIKKLFDMHSVCRIFVALWIMEDEMFTMFNQWLPEEMSNDVLSLVFDYNVTVRSFF